MPHKTPLTYHFKGAHLWFDIAVLVVLFIAATYFPLLKIVPLIASLELFSFFCFHLLARNSRFPLQGFLGGFISSTAVFLQTLNDSKFAAVGDRALLSTLLCALCAMLLECLFIIYFLGEGLALINYLPFISQLIFFVAAIAYIHTRNNGPFAHHHAVDAELNIDLLNDHPIIWKNVAKLSLLIFLIIFAMHYIGSELGLSRGISTFFISLFEAHAILASVMTEWALQSKNIHLMELFLIILLGNTLSKSYLVLNGTNLKQKKFFVMVMSGGLVASVAVTFIFSVLLFQN